MRSGVNIYLLSGRPSWIKEQRAESEDFFSHFLWIVRTLNDTCWYILFCQTHTQLIWDYHYILSLTQYAIMRHWSLITDTSYQVSLSQAILYLLLICWPGPGLTDGVLAEEVRWAGREQWATLWNSDPPTHFPGIEDQSNDCMRTGLTGQEWEVFHIREIDELGSH